MRTLWCLDTVHAVIGLCLSNSLVSPFNKDLQAETEYITKTTRIKEVIKDWSHQLTEVGSKPTHCKELVPGGKTILGPTDASGNGCGREWFVLDGKFQDPVV